MSSMERIRRPGGTPGGLGSFALGGVLAVAGAYLLLNHVQVRSGYWHWWGDNTFGLTLIPLLIGVGLLFFNGKSLAGWVLAAAGAVVILAGIIASMSLYLPSTSLYNVLLMLVMFVAGLGLMARALR